MSEQKPVCIIDVPLIAKQAKDAGNEDVYIKEVELPNGQKIDLHLYLFGTPREPLQAGNTCNGICF